MPGGAEKFKASLNAPNDCGSLHNRSPDSVAQARSRFFDGFHRAGQNLIDVNELQTQPFHGLREDSVHLLRLAACQTSQFRSIRNDA